MKAADARRQRSLPRKRARVIETFEGEVDPRCQLAERLLDAFKADVRAQTKSVVAGQHEQCVEQLKDQLATLEQLGAWVERLVEMQMRWVECGSRVDNDAALRLWNQLDDIILRVCSRSERMVQLETLRRDLPAFVADAVRVASVTRKQAALTVHSQAPGAGPMVPSAPPIRTPLVAPLCDGRVELLHQWAPRILLQISDSVEKGGADGRCRPELVAAMRRLLAVIRDHNPYAFFSIIYRPPPPDVEASSWTLYGSSLVDGIARLLRDDFDQIRDLAEWMFKPDSRFWRLFARFMTLVRRVSIGFHRVMLHFYAMAMQRHDPHLCPDDVRREIKEAFADHVSLNLQTEAYGLAKWLQFTDDPILQETYMKFPEVIVYIEQWRHEYSVYEHGYAPKERARDYEVGYNKWKSSRTWLQIAHHAKRLVQRWSQSRLGSREFRTMTIQELGNVEKDVKYRLTEITNLLYKQNIAKWSQQMYQYGRVRLLKEIQLLEHTEGLRSVRMVQSSGRYERAQAEKIEASTHGDIKFRSPTRSAGRILQSPSMNAGVNVEAIDEDDILKWCDEEIDSHEQETERVYQLQEDMVMHHDKIALPRLLSKGSRVMDDGIEGIDLFYHSEIDDNAAVAGLISGMRKLRASTTQIIVSGEEIALHGAAEALIQRPALRVQPEPVVPESSLPETTPADESICAEEAGEEPAVSTDGLVSALETSASRLCDFQKSAVAGPFAMKSAQRIALEALSLLHLAQEQIA